MVRRLLASVILAAFPVVVIPIAVTSIGARAGAAPPTAVQQCKDGGWQTLTDASGQPFKNQGRCIAYAIHHPVSLADLASSSAFPGTITVENGNGCTEASQALNATYLGSPNVGNVTLVVEGCINSPPTDFAGSFTLSTVRGSLSGSASGSFSVSELPTIPEQITLDAIAGTGSFAGTTGSLLFSNTSIAFTPNPIPFVGSVTVP
jgi:hypothetical protein